jgi:glycerophosphoryl diester phosphodiesterase
MVKPLVIAHRGDSAHAPENTMRAFEQAIAKGADWIETDLRLTNDGEIVAFHDPDLRRLAGRDGVLGDLRYRDIQDLKIDGAGPVDGGGFADGGSPVDGSGLVDAGGSAGGTASSATIPRLADILHGVGKRVPFYLELKSDGRGRESERNLELLDRCLGMVGANSPHAFASFDLDLVRGAMEAGRRGVYTVEHTSALDLCSDEELRNMFAVSVAHDCLDDELAGQLKSVGARLWAWTVDTRIDIERMLELGVEGLCTNDVANTIAILEERGR